MKDNGDPSFELSESLEKLGIALASAVVYANEYAKEAEKAKSAPAKSEKKTIC